jgi:hypothetical protein
VRSKAYELCAAAAANTVRCAIYTGKSSEEGLEQEFNSLQAQREACEAFIVAHRAPPISGPVRWTLRSAALTTGISFRRGPSAVPSGVSRPPIAA